MIRKTFKRVKNLIGSILRSRRIRGYIGKCRKVLEISKQKVAVIKSRSDKCINSNVKTGPRKVRENMI